MIPLKYEMHEKKCDFQFIIPGLKILYKPKKQHIFA